MLSVSATLGACAGVMRPHEPLDIQGSECSVTPADILSASGELLAHDRTRLVRLSELPQTVRTVERLAECLGSMESGER